MFDQTDAGNRERGRLSIAQGSRYGRLTVLGFVRDAFTASGQIRPIYAFRCDCGEEVETRIYSVRSGKTKNCGCAQREGRPRHGNCAGGSLSPEWRAWRDMLTRATNPKIAHAAHYVGRGITVCDEWRSGGDGNGFVRFLAHLGKKPSPRHSIDRIDNDRGYAPGNVRWATPATQSGNRTDNVYVYLGDERMCLTEAARRSGIKPSIVAQRIAKLGWSLDRALTKPPKPDRRRAA